MQREGAGVLAGAEQNGHRPDLEIRLPKDTSVAQDQEWCEVVRDGEVERIRFHDYHRIYAIPGLYELLFAEMLECASPRIVVSLLKEQLEREDVATRDLTALDLGAGNGMVGEELDRIGVDSMVGVDVIEEARDAAERDRPDLYDDYLVADMAALSRATESRLRARGFGCLTTVAALGFGDIPPTAFVAAYNLVADEGWVAFNIKKDFLDGADGTGFSRLLRRMFEDGTMEELSRREYPHRLAVNGEALPYVAIVARKRRGVELTEEDRTGG